jgi:hypothetical protein
MPSQQSAYALRGVALGILILTGGVAHASSVTVNFDLLPDGTPFLAPNQFVSTTALREQFAADGVHFAGGGGVLTGYFGVAGTGGLNFLAFNARAAAHYADGSTAAPPEQIRFDRRADLVRLLVGSSEGGTATLTAFDAAGNTVASAQLGLTATLAPLQVSSTDYNIVSVGLGVAGSRSAVVDNLVFVVRDAVNLPPTTQCALAGPAGANGWYLGDVTATLTAQDADGTVASTQYRVDGGAWQPYSMPVVVTGEGKHTLEYQSVDNAGAWENVQSDSLKIDTTPPVVDLHLSQTFLWPPNGKMLPVVVAGSASDTPSGSGVTGVVFQVVDEYGKVQPSLSAFGQTIQLQAWVKPRDRDGRYYRVIAAATDAAGRKTTVSRWVWVPEHGCRWWKQVFKPAGDAAKIHR